MSRFARKNAQDVDTQFPRVLLISRASVSDADPSGISRGRWFQHWPKDRIAQIYSSEGSMGDPFCPIRYEFGAMDRRWGRLFAKLKHSSMGSAFRIQSVTRPAPSRLHRTFGKFRLAAVAWVVESGLWELAFAPKASSQLLRWCEAFAPDLLYSTCTDLSFTELTLQLAQALRVPICFQVEDDWMGTLYTTGFARYLVRSRLERNMRSLLAASTLRLSNGPLMTAAYRRDYGCEFEPVFLSDDIARFDCIPHQPRSRTDALTIVYSGSLQLDRWEGLLDLDRAIELLPQEVGRVRIRVFTNHVPSGAAERLAACPRIELRAGLVDAQVPATLKQADVLFLPESFHLKWRQYIRYSISSKAHLYMMAGRPAIVYGPSGIGVIEYAREGQWAEVVDERNPARLAGALAALLANERRVAALLARARGVALRNHEAGQVREQFRQALVRCAGANQDTTRPGCAT